MKLVSGRIGKIPSANISADRYQFIQLSETEPDLGLPAELGQIFTSDLDGNRYWVRLDTANVSETTNQYFSNVRVLQAVEPLLTTANVVELDNFYFTAERVLGALEGNNVTLNNLVVSGDLEVQGNLVSINTTTLNIEDKNILLANGAVNSAAADGAGLSIAGADAEIIYVNSGDKFSTNKNLNVQGNVEIDGTFIGNDLIIRNIVVSDVVSDTLTANVITANVVASAEWDGIYTSNVIESPTNLYYTNDRVYSFVTGMSIGDLVDVSNLYTYNSGILVGIQEGQALVWDGNVFIPVFVNSEVANVADLAVKVLNLENQTTANVREASSNLYFTNTRVLDAISLSDINPYNITANGNLVVIGNTTLQSANVGSVYFNSGERFTPYTLEGESDNFNIWVKDGLTISDLNSGARWYIGGLNVHNYDIVATDSSNIRLNTGHLAAPRLYTTDAVLDNLTANNINTTFANINTLNATHVEFDHVSIRTNLVVYGDVTTYGANDLVISDPLIYINEGSNTAANPDIGIIWAFDPDANSYQHGGIFRDADDGVIKFFENYRTEPDANLFLDTVNSSSGFELANIQASALIGNVVGVVSSLDNHTTDSLNEGSSNLYYTDARVVNAVNPLLTTANVLELDNLYFTNARVLSNVEQMSINVLADVDITDVSVNATLIWDGTKFIPGSTDTSLRSNFANTAGSSNVALLADVANIALLADVANVALLADVANVALLTDVANTAGLANLVSSLSNHNTSNLAEGTNLYFSNAKARSAFTGGRGIIIQEDGVIKSTIGSYLFNTEVNGTQSYVVTNSMSAALTLNSSPVDDRYIIRSMHVTNISDSPAYISANVLYATGNTASLANLIPVPVGGILEFMDKPQILQPTDKINIQGFNSSGAPASNLLHTTFSIEQIPNDITYFGTGLTLPTSNTNTLLVNAEQSYAVIESIKFVNLKTYSVPVKLLITDANNIVKSYLAYNTQVPPNSSLEILQTPKNLASTDKLYASYSNASNADAISVFTSYRYSSITDVAYTQTSGGPGQTVSVNFSTTIEDGTTLYYTLE